MSRLRAKCPDCRAYTAVALGAGYECHACGRAFAAALVRVPRAWGAGGDAMAEAARLELPYPEAAVVAEDDPRTQAVAVALALPERPVVVGGCCCAHVGAVEALAARHGRIALVWLDAHGDLNTPETSPSGNAWGMPLRGLLDAGTVQPADTALVGARALDPPEREYIAGSRLPTGIGGADAAVEGTEGVYIALDLDAFAANEVAPFMAEPGGMALDEAEDLLRRIASQSNVLGAGVSGATLDERNTRAVERLLAAAGL